jgi:hypothetical protein
MHGEHRPDSVQEPKAARCTRVRSWARLRSELFRFAWQFCFDSSGPHAPIPGCRSALREEFLERVFHLPNFANPYPLTLEFLDEPRDLIRAGDLLEVVVAPPLPLG